MSTDRPDSVLDVDSAGRAGMDHWLDGTVRVGGQVVDEADVPSWDEL